VDLLTIFFPKKCINCKKFGDYLCPNCFVLLDFDVALICGICGKHAVSGLTHPKCMGRNSIDGIFASLVYRGLTKKLVYQFKFAPYLHTLSSLLVDLLYEGLIQQESFIKNSTKDFLFVPIPLHPGRQRERGYNQALILSQGLSKKLGVETRELLSKTKATSSQVGKTGVERRQNIKGIFTLVDEIPQDTTIFLVDDVVTSGATLNEAAGVLKRAGAKAVYGIALAHGL
jgi:ComF family protein